MRGHSTRTSHYHYDQKIRIIFLAIDFDIMFILSFEPLLKISNLPGFAGFFIQSSWRRNGSCDGRVLQRLYITADIVSSVRRRAPWSIDVHLGEKLDPS